MKQTCPSCGHSVDEDLNVCPDCGQQLSYKAADKAAKAADKTVDKAARSVDKAAGKMAASAGQVASGAQASSARETDSWSVYPSSGQPPVDDPRTQRSEGKQAVDDKARGYGESEYKAAGTATSTVTHEKPREYATERPTERIVDRPEEYAVAERRAVKEPEVAEPRQRYETRVGGEGRPPETPRKQSYWWLWPLLVVLAAALALGLIFGLRGEETTTTTTAITTTTTVAPTTTTVAPTTTTAAPTTTTSVGGTTTTSVGVTTTTSG